MMRALRKGRRDMIADGRISQRTCQNGFTLVEMAVVVVLMGMLMTMGLKILTATLNNSAHSETVMKQDRIKQALVAFMRSNGRLPCPDNPANNAAAGSYPAGSANGQEEAACTANAQAAYGVLPWVTLGLAREDAQDGWGNLFTYRVANANGVQVNAGPVSPPLHRNSNHNWTRRTGVPAPFDIVSLTPQSALGGFQTLQIADAAGTLESRTAVAVIVSHGSNGLGAWTIRAAARMPNGVGSELTNSAANTLQFVKSPQTDNPVFDDVVAYLTPQDLLQPLLNEGSLRACSQYCPAPHIAPCTTDNNLRIPVGLSPVAPAVGLSCPAL